MRSLLFLISFLISLGLQAQTQKIDPQYGLAFASHEVSKDHRTGLDLNPEEPYHFDQDFILKFDLSLQRLTNAYGYILRIIANDTLNFDLMSTPEHDEFSDLTLVVNNKPTSLKFEFSDVALKPNQWTTISISFSYKLNRVSLSWNGQTKVHPCAMKDLHAFRFYFGVNDFAKFSTSDAPPVIIKNISLKEENISVRKWPLKKHNRHEVYDSVANAVALVKNPMWLIDRHTKWVHRKSFSIGRFPSVSFNNDSAIVYAVDKSNFYNYDLNKDVLEIRKVQDGNLAYTDANQLLYIKGKHQLLNYDVATNKMLPYDFEKDRWENNDTTYHEPNYWHNNKFFNTEDNALYVFGGYGHFTYKNNFFRYDEGQKQWVDVKTDGTIPPRYLAASGFRPSTNQILIFGGYGSLSGKQELSPQSFYDLYSFDLKTHAVKKLREYSPAESSEDIVFSNSLVVNEEARCFYVLSYPKNKYESFAQLRQYSLETNETKILADSIPFRFHDEDSFCDLFFSSSTNELIAVTVHQEKETYQVNIHSIQYPPLRSSDVLQPGTSFNATLAIVVLMVVFGGAFALLLIYRKKKETAATNQPVQNVASPVAHLGGHIPAEEHRLVSSILLFGGFQVFDKEGNDISSKFTMTLKELFSLILLHSIKYEKGISAPVIQEYLWPDKDEVSARNNRNVNIKKLRTLLDEIGGISVENNNSYLKLTMDEHVFCDYQTVHRLLHDRSDVIPENEKIAMLISNVNRGNLLPNLQTNWLDNFKSDISNQIIDTLLEYSQKLDRKTDDKLLLEIADAVFTYDTINQEALVIKCSVLNKKGKYSLAKTWYDHFVKEYKNLYSENYPRTFEEVIS
jgi:DNA-binding SARP family transcriptional activator